MAQKILLIDDDEGYVLATRGLLEAAGYEVSTAGSVGARKQLESKTPDLILLDMIMPAEDGFTFAQRLSQSKVVTEVPVILVTAVAESQGQIMSACEQDEGLTAVDILPKSQVHERLLECVASVFGESQDARTA